MFIRRCGPRPWISNVNIGSRRGAWGNRVSPCPHPREGLGGRSPPRNNCRFIAALCGAAAWTANVNIGSRRGCGETGFPHAPAPQGHGETGFPHAPTRGRVWEGAALPGTTVCSSRRCARIAWTANVNIGCESQSPCGAAAHFPSLSPLGGGAGVPPPAGEGQGRGGHRARGDAMRAGRPRSQVMFIAALGTMRMTVSREHRLLEQGCGETGFPHAPACGRA